MYKDLTDEGVIELSRLPKLESFELIYGGPISSLVFKHFRTLKNVKCFRMTNMEEGLPILLKNCSNFQSISILHFFRHEELYEIFKPAVEMLKKRSNIDNSLSVIFSSKFVFRQIRIRMSPMRSKNDSSTKIWFELFHNHRNLTSDFTTNDFDILMKEVALSIDKRD